MLTFALDHEARDPLYIQLKQHLIRQIDNGILAPGDRLPPTRDLAGQLGVGRISVITAYEELKAEGYIDAQVGRGTYVIERESFDAGPDTTALVGTNPPQDPALRDLMRYAERPGVLNFAHGMPAESFLPIDLIRQALDTVITRDGSAAIAYEAPEGYRPLRNAIAAMVSASDIHVDPEEVLVTGGCQQALDLAVQALLNPGDVLLTSNPTYAGMIDIAQARGVNTLGVPLDEDGMQTDALESQIIEHRPRMLYVAPTYHNPTGAVMPLHRRRHLLEIANRYHLPILEDGVYEALAYEGEPPPSLKALDEHGLVLYASSFSKVLLPGMRIGYLLAGSRLYRRVARVKQAADICTPSLNQRAIHVALASGQLQSHIAEVRVTCQIRRTAMLDALGQHLSFASWAEPQGGMYLWLALPEDGPTAIELYLRAVDAGMAFAPGALFYTDGGGSHHLRLNMIAHDPDTIRTGVRILGEAWQTLADDYQPLPSSPSSHVL